MKVQKFGIELRKIGTVHAIYDDVDSILDGMSLKEVQTDTIAHAMHKMLKVKEWLDVTTITECRDIAQVHIPKEHMQIYRAVHCMHWNEMTTEYRQTIVAMILNDFRTVLNPQP